jgi:hypothetical protein
MRNLWGMHFASTFLVLLPEGLRFVGMPSAIAANMRQIFYGGMLIFEMFRNSWSVTNEKGEVWGTVMCQQTIQVVNERGFVSAKTRAFFMRMRQDQFNGAFFTEGRELPGMLIRKLSHKPFSPNQKPIVNPTTGEVHYYDGKEMYQNFEINAGISTIEEFNKLDSRMVDEVTAVSRKIDANELFEAGANGVETVAQAEEVLEAVNDLPFEIPTGNSKK